MNPWKQTWDDAYCFTITLDRLRLFKCLKR